MLVLMALAAHGATIVVDASGGGDHTSIQAAIDAAAAGDTILVLDGTYDEWATYTQGYTIDASLKVDKTLTIVGESTDGVVVRSGTTSAADVSTSVLVADGAYDVTIRNLTFQNTVPGNSPLWGEAWTYTGFWQGTAASGRYVFRNVVFELAADHPKAIFHTAAPSAENDVHNVTVDFGADEAGFVCYYDVMNGGSEMRNVIVANGNGQHVYFAGAVAGTGIPTEYSLLQGHAASGTNLDGDPMFVDGAAGDYHLDSGSPAIDAGDPDPSWNDDDGSRNDMGAFGGSSAEWPYDADGDGFSADGTLGGAEDCDDDDATVHPDAEEVPNDGVDNDCDPTTEDAVDTDAPTDTDDTDVPEDTDVADTDLPDDTDPPDDTDLDDTGAGVDDGTCGCRTGAAGGLGALPLLLFAVRRRSSRR